VHAVEHQRGRPRPDERPAAGQLGQHARGEQAERRQQQGGHPQVVGVVAGEQPGEPHEHAGDDRILHRAADQVALRLVGIVHQLPVQVREGVLGHAPADPELLDVGVAQLVVFVQAEVGRDAELVERRPGAGRLGQVAEQDPERRRRQHRPEHQIGPATDGGQCPLVGQGASRRRPATGPRRQRFAVPPGTRVPLARRALALAHRLTPAAAPAGTRCPRPAPRAAPASRPGSAPPRPRTPRRSRPGRCDRR
jgi:hypothetical protein